MNPVDVESVAQYQSRGQLSEHARQRLLSIATRRTWRKGEVMLRAGEVAPYLCVVEDGAVRSSRIGRAGAEELMSLPHDALIGLASVVGQQPSRFGLTAAQTCVTTLYDGPRFRELLLEDAPMAREIAAMLARGVVLLQDIVQEAREQPLIERVHRELLRLRSTGQGRRETDGFAVRLSQYDFACLVGSTREAVNPVLKQLEKQGVLRLGYRTIVLLDTRAAGNP